MEGYLRRMRLQFVENPNCLALAKVCCDEIEELEPFKRYVEQSRKSCPN